LRAYRLRLRRLTPEQTKVLRTWFAAQRWGFNTMLAAVRSGTVANTQKVANEFSHRPPAWVKDTHRQIYKNAMMDLVSAGTAEKTKREKNPSHRGTIQFRSLRRTPTECCRLDKCQWKTDDPNHERNPHDKGLVFGIRTVPEETNDDAAGESPPLRKRLRAHIEFGRGLGTVEVRDRRWLIERLAADVYLRHEAKLHWDKRGGVFALIVLLDRERPADPDPECHRKRVVALDPGTRRFQTYYDPASGETGTVLCGYQQRPNMAAIPVDGAVPNRRRRSSPPVTVDRSAGDEIERRCHTIDRKQSRADRRRRWWTRAGHRSAKEWAAAAAERIVPAANDDHPVAVAIYPSDDNMDVDEHRRVVRPPAATIDSDDDAGGGDAFLRSAAAMHLGRRSRVRFWCNELRSGRMSVDEWSRRIQRRAHQTQRQARRDCDRARRHLHHFKHHMHYAAIGFLWRHWDVVIASTANIGTMCRRERWDARGNVIVSHIKPKPATVNPLVGMIPSTFGWVIGVFYDTGDW
jgi:hypothetical protein